jgi:hypothetical protein
MLYTTTTTGVLERLSPYAAHARKAATAAQAERKEKRAELITERRTQAKVCSVAVHLAIFHTAYSSRAFST